MPQPVSKPLDSVLPYNKDYRKHRQSALSRETFNEHVMNSGDSGSDADESEHATKGTRDRSRTLTNLRQNRSREKQSENLQGSPGKNRRTSRTDTLEDQRTSRGGLQIRSQVATKRTVRHIPGRFSALDSDEEEESLRQEEAARVRTLIWPLVISRCVKPGFLIFLWSLSDWLGTTSLTSLFNRRCLGHSFEHCEHGLAANAAAVAGIH